MPYTRPDPLYRIYATDPTYGATGDGSTDDRAAIQSAIDALATLMALDGNYIGPGEVVLPGTASTYKINKPLYLDKSRVHLVGDGPTTTLFANGQFSPIYLSIPRVQTVSGTPTQPSASNRPDANGILDSTFASGTGQRWGFKTNNNSCIKFVACPPACGVKCADSAALAAGMSDNWGETNKLTLEVALKAASGVVQQQLPILGMGRIDGMDIGPFLLKGSDATDKVTLVIRTADQNGGETAGSGEYRTYSFSLGTSANARKITCQVDLTTGVVTAFVDGTQVTVTPGDNPTLPTPTTFCQNDNKTFLVGSDGVGSETGTAGFDGTFYGLSVHNKIRYKNNGVGQAQVRVDNNAAPTDAYRYITSDSNTVFYLPFTDAQTTSREVTVTNGGATYGGTSYGLLVHTVSPEPTTRAGVDSIKIVGGGNYGQGVALGCSQDATLTDLWVSGCFHGVGSVPAFCAYDTSITGRTTGSFRVDGIDAVVSLDKHLYEIRNIRAVTTGRNGFRFRACGGSIKGVFVERASAISECTFKFMRGDYGGNHAVEDALVDFEGATYTNAAIYMERHEVSPQSSLTVNRVYLGTVGTGVPWIKLRDSAAPDAGGFAPAALIVNDISAFDYTGSVVVEVDGPSWHGNIETAALLGVGARVVHTGRWSDACNIVIRERGDAPPTTGSWVAGASMIESGTGESWACTTSGTFGTESPAVFTAIGGGGGGGSTNLSVFVNNGQTTLQSAYVAANGSVHLKTGYGATLAAKITAAGFSDVSSLTPLRFTLADALSIVAGIGPTTNLSIFKATGLSGDTLSGVTAIEGTTDQNFPAHAAVYFMLTAGAIAEMQAAIGSGGGGGGSGSVTSVDMTVPAGFAVSGNPITDDGTLAITTALSGIVKGTGSGFTNATADTDYATPAYVLAHVGGITIGASVSGGTNSHVLYVDGSGNLACASGVDINGSGQLAIPISGQDDAVFLANPNSRGLKIIGGGSQGEIATAGLIRADGGYSTSTSGNGTSLLPNWVGDTNELQGVAFPGDGANGSYVQIFAATAGTFVKTKMAEFIPSGTDAGIRFKNGGVYLLDVSDTVIAGFSPVGAAIVATLADAAAANGSLFWGSDHSGSLCEKTPGGSVSVVGGGGSGTVTTVSVATANGFSGSVATATTTPVITLTTSITGLLKGDGTAISAASAGTDYLTPGGVGTLLTALNATNLGSGTVPTARLGSGSATSSTFLRGDQTWATPATVSAANPTALVGLTAVNGSATSFTRSDGAPALDVSIAPTWTGKHVHSLSNASAWAIGPNGDTNPVLRVVTNTASQATGVSITGSAVGGAGGGFGCTLQALSSATDEDLTLKAKGSGYVHIGGGGQVGNLVLEGQAKLYFYTWNNGTSVFENFGINVTGDSIHPFQVGSAGIAVGWQSGGATVPVGSVVAKIALAASPIFVSQGTTSQTGAHYTLRGQSSTTAGRDMAVVDATWASNTDASRKGRLQLYAADASGTNQEGVRVESSGSAPLLGFYGATAVAKAASPGVAAGTDAAVINALITALRNLGLIT